MGCFFVISHTIIMKHYKKHNKKTTKYKKKQQNHFAQLIACIIIGLIIAGASYFILQDLKYFNSTLIISIEIGIVLVLIGWVILNRIIKFIKTKTYKSTMYKIDRMTGQEFEIVLKKYFEKRGYRVETTPTSNDYGADLILHKGGIKTIVQAKRYKNSVGNSAVQEIVAAKAFYKAKKCLVITNSYFTKNAQNLAKVNGVELWDRNKLRTEFNIKD